MNQASPNTNASAAQTNELAEIANNYIVMPGSNEQFPLLGNRKQRRSDMAKAKRAIKKLK
jgi:hypothetical protein